MVELAAGVRLRAALGRFGLHVHAVLRSYNQSYMESRHHYQYHSVAFASSARRRILDRRYYHVFFAMHLAFFKKTLIHLNGLYE